MKVKDLMKNLEKLNPDEQICVLWWERENFVETSEEVWNKVCDIFDKSDSVGDDVTMTLVQTITDIESEEN